MASKVVKRTFYLKGVLQYSNLEIARLYNKENIMSPAEYMSKKAGKKLFNYSSRTKIWTSDAVEHILWNPVYLGITISGKSETMGPGIKKVVRTPKEEYRVIEGTHPALVTREMFDLVQSPNSRAFIGKSENNYGQGQQIPEIRQKKYVLSGKYKMPEEMRVTCISGMVRCGMCGHIMQHRYRRSGTFYDCHYANMSDELGCMHGSFPELELIELVTAAVNRQIEAAVKLQEIQDVHNKQISKKRMEAEKKKKRLQDKKAILKLKYMEVYQKYQEDIISKDKFLAFKAEKRKKDDFIDTELTEIDTELKQFVLENNPFLKMCKGRMKPEKLTRDLSEQLIEVIKVYSRQKIEVVFKYQDEFEKMATLLGEFAIEQK